MVCILIQASKALTRFHAFLSCVHDSVWLLLRRITSRCRRIRSIKPPLIDIDPCFGFCFAVVAADAPGTCPARTFGKHQTQDRLFVATNPNLSEGSGGAGERRNPATMAAAMGEVVGDDSMVVGKGIMIKGDVDNCAVRMEVVLLLCFPRPVRTLRSQRAIRSKRIRPRNNRKSKGRRRHRKIQFFALEMNQVETTIQSIGKKAKEREN